MREKNVNSQIFSAHIMAGDLERLLETTAGAVREQARVIHARNPSKLYLVASGASMTALFVVKYMMERYSRLPTELVVGAELLAMAPPTADSTAVALSASYSGKTADTLGGLRFLRQRGVHTIGFVNDERSEAGQMLDVAFGYNSKALFTSAMALGQVFCAELMHLRGEFGDYARFRRSLDELPDVVRAAQDSAEQTGGRIADALEDSGLVYVLADGPLCGTGYQTAYTTIMEYLRVNSSFIPTTEFRHGPLEVLGNHPDMLVLLGTDGTRCYGEDTITFARRHGACVQVIDSRELGETHELLTPYLVYPAMQWYILHAAVKKAIDLDEYLYMHVYPYREGEQYY
jgi:fructoselysine-6-P-deglycase FrlB-like protein